MGACPGYNRVYGLFTDDFAGAYFGSYGYNGGGINPYVSTGLGIGGSAIGPENPSFWIATRESQVLYPSDMIAMGDAILMPDYWRGTLPPLGLGWTLNTALLDRRCWNCVLLGLPAGDSSVVATRQRHGGRYNVAFCDGHSESLLATNLFDVRKPAVAQRWNNDHQAHEEILAGW